MFKLTIYYISIVLKSSSLTELLKEKIEFIIIIIILQAKRNNNCKFQIIDETIPI